MNFPEVLAEVLRITKRPDKTASATLAINKALTYCTLLGDFPRDTVEASLPVSDATAYGGAIDLSALTGFRRFTYIKPTARMYYLTYLSPDKVFTPKGKMQPDRYYVAGQTLTYTLSELTTALEVAYLTYPTPVGGAVIDHWMLEHIPYIIIDLASAYVFSEIGDDASANKHEKLGRDLFLTARRDLAQGT